MKPVLRRATLARALLAVVCVWTAAAAPAASTAKAPLGDGAYATIRGGRTLFLECTPPEGDAAKSFFAQYLAQPDTWASYKAAGAIIVPYTKLNAETQKRLLLSVFPRDYVNEQGWWHTVTYAGGDAMESWWALSEWLIGRGTAYRELLVLEQNKHLSPTLAPGDVVFVPKEMLRPHLAGPAPAGAAAPPAPALTPAPAASPPVPVAESPSSEPKRAQQFARVKPKNESAAPRERTAIPTNASTTPLPKAAEHAPVLLPAPSVQEPEPGAAAPPVQLASANPKSVVEALRESEAAAAAAPLFADELRYGKDKEGDYAEYRLKRGEALYSAVVARFTDYREPGDILQAAEIIADRSGIKDVTDIDAGAPIRIPLDMVSARFMPQGSVQREEYEDVIREAKRLRGDRVRSRDLEGVVIILDPGHGGRDHGAADTKSGVYEDEVAYDIVCRIMQLIESQTRAKVYTTMVDPSQGYRPVELTRFLHDADEEVLVTPRYANYDARVSANLRWYLANSIYRREVKNGTDPRKIVFASIHCDALYTTSLRGAMVYVPGAAWRRESEQPMGAVYASYREPKEALRVSCTADERKRDEALSRNFAETFLASLRNNKPAIKVHDAGDPVRNVIRQSGGKAYVPAVLRNNIVPTKVLIEAANLTNATDVERAADPKWRQWFAESFVRALSQHFES